MSEADSNVIARGSSPATASPTGSRRPGEAGTALLTVIYPVFDTRGDVTERVRLWTQQQELEPSRYQVFVVAGTEGEFNEARLRTVLRDHDAILRAPGDLREADQWNVGADAAQTPWLLFVEAHGIPKPDSLSALAAWIDAHPEDKVWNFRIENLDHHRIAKLMKRWFAQVIFEWTDPATWPRLHRTAFAIRRDLFAKIRPIEAQYGQFAPALLSARMHQAGLKIATMPSSGIIHDDAPDISQHHDDTADYVRGEMDARTRYNPAFFEKYFGTLPLYGRHQILDAPQARAMLKAVLIAALHGRGGGHRILKRAFRLVPAALCGLRLRASLLGLLTRIDERVIMQMPRLERLRWRRFLLAHRRVIRATQMTWLAQHPSLPLDARAGTGRWPIEDVGQRAIVGLDALERRDGKALRWTGPVFLIRIAPPAGKSTVTLETRNLRPVAVSDVVAVAGGRLLDSRDIAIDDLGNIRLQIPPAPQQDSETSIVMMVRELRESGRRLGLPLFSVQLST